MENVETNEKSLDTLKRLVSAAYVNIEKISHIIEKIEQEQKRELYKSIPGIEGTYDGAFMIADDGKKYEVPANYAAKSRLVFGDRLKMVEEVGKTLFKQLDKVARKDVEGVLSKKEGKWYILTDAGTFKISDVAAEFNNAQLNEKAIVIIPDGNTPATFAALDKIIRPETQSVWKEKPAFVNKPYVRPATASASAPAAKPVVAKPVAPAVVPAERKASVAPVPAPAPKKDLEIKPVRKPKVEESPKEFIADLGTPAAQQTTQSLLDDDDLR